MTWYLWTGGIIAFIIIGILIIRRINGGGNSSNVFDRGSSASRSFIDCCMRFLKGKRSEA